MLARIQECILYRGFSNGEILDDMTELINLYEADEEALKAREDQFFKSVNGLVELAGMYGFSGNIFNGIQIDSACVFNDVRIIHTNGSSVTIIQRIRIINTIT